MEIYSLFTLLSEEERQKIVDLLDERIQVLIESERDKKPSMRNMVDVPLYVDDQIEFANELGVQSKFTPLE